MTQIRDSRPWVREVAIALRDIEAYCKSLRDDFAAERHDSGVSECAMNNIRNAAQECIDRLWPAEPRGGA